MRLPQNDGLDIQAWVVENDPLPVRAVNDPHAERGFDARSAYVETFWLPIVGPSCVLTARRLVSWLEAEPEGFEISLIALAGSLGLGAGMGRHAPIVRTLARLANFGLASVDDHYAVREIPAIVSSADRTLARSPRDSARTRTRRS